MSPIVSSSTALLLGQAVGAHGVVDLLGELVHLGVRRVLHRSALLGFGALQVCASALAEWFDGFDFVAEVAAVFADAVAGEDVAHRPGLDCAAGALAPEGGGFLAGHERVGHGARVRASA
jgi:hypothetical protein